MTGIKTILVHVDFQDVLPARVKFAADLASRFGAKLIGLSAAQMPSMTPSIGRGRFTQFETSEIEEQLDKVRQRFGELVPASVQTEWRGEVGSPTQMVARHACAADLLVASSHSGSDLAESDVGDLAMMAGRPVLDPALGAEALSAETILVAWRNTREARRAVRDALPFLALAKDVRIASIVGDANETEEIDAVVGYLAAHGVSAEPLIVEGDQRHRGAMLLQRATEIGAGLIVAGAFGHSRFRELAFGGATRDLLHQTDISVLLSN